MREASRSLGCVHRNDVAEPQPQAPLGLDRAAPFATRAGLGLRIGSERASAHARDAAHQRGKGDVTPGPLLRLEAAQLELQVDVLAADDLGRTGCPECLIE